MASVDSEHVPVETIPPEETAIVSDRSESESFPLPDAVSIPDEGNLGAVPDDPALSDTRMTVPENASEKKGFFSGFHFPEIPPCILDRTRCPSCRWRPYRRRCHSQKPFQAEKLPESASCAGNGAYSA